jgi:hypothetical protein
MFTEDICGDVATLTTVKAKPILARFYIIELMKGRRFNETCRIDGRETASGQKGGLRLIGAKRGSGSTSAPRHRDERGGNKIKLKKKQLGNPPRAPFF